MQHLPETGFHLWHKWSVVQSHRGLKRILSEGRIVIPVSVGSKPMNASLRAYLRDLQSFEDDRKMRQGVKPRYLHRLEILLPRDFADDSVSDLIKAVFTLYGLTDETYFARIFMRKSSRYLAVYISERTWWPDGNMVTTYYSADIYADSATKRRCHADDDGAVKIHSKGDVLSCEETCFSNKSGKLNLGRKQLKANIYRMRDLLSTFFMDHKCTEHYGYLLPRIDYSGMSYNKRRHIKTINRMYLEMESAMNRAREKLYAAGLQEYIAKLDQLLRKLRGDIGSDCIIRGVHQEKGKRYRAMICYFRNFAAVVYAMELYVSNFLLRLAAILRDAFASIGKWAVGTYSEILAYFGMFDVESSFAYRTYVWSESRIPKDHVLTAAQLEAIRARERANFAPCQ